MVRNNNSIPPYGEEIRIEQSTIQELQEQIRVLQIKNEELENELKETEEENEDLDKMVWNGIKKLETEREEKRQLQEQNKKDKKSHLLSLLRENSIKKNTGKLLHRWFEAEGKIYNLEKEKVKLEKEKRGLEDNRQTLTTQNKNLQNESRVKSQTINNLNNQISQNQIRINELEKLNQSNMNALNRRDNEYWEGYRDGEEKGLEAGMSYKLSFNPYDED